MSIEAEQRVATAARLQVTWHYARLLSTKQYRHNALLAHKLGPEFPEEVGRMQDEIAHLHRDMQDIRMDAHQAGVFSSLLDRAVDALEDERRVLAAMVVAELTAPGRTGRYPSHEHAGWRNSGEPIR